MKKATTNLILASTLALCAAFAAYADRDYTGAGGTTEWSNTGNWTSNSSNWYWIHNDKSPANFNFTFSSGPSGWADDNSDYYNVWCLTLRDIPSGETVNFTADEDSTGLNIRSGFRIGYVSRGALAINKGTFTAADYIAIGPNENNNTGSGELTMNGGTLSVANDINLAVNADTTGALVMNGGTLTVGGSITQGSGTGTVDLNGGVLQVAGDIGGGLTLNGGTLRAAADKTLELGGATLASGGVGFDTNGHTVNVYGSLSNDLATIVKTGDGTLMLESVPDVAALAVSNGTVKILSGTEPRLRRRWGFNDMKDSVTGAEATVTGSFTLSDSAISLPGGTQGSGYIDLGSDVLPLDNTPFTIEMWTTFDEAVNWVRMFSFGSEYFLYNGIHLTYKSDDAKPQFMLRSAENEKANVFLNAEFVVGTEYYVVITMAPDASTSKTRVHMGIYNASTKEKVDAWSDTYEWLPSCMTDTEHPAKYYLGRSMWGASENDAKATFDEVRIWEGALGEEQILTHLENGPNLLRSDALLHRWSFNGNASDKAGGGTASLITNAYNSDAGGTISYINYNTEVSLSGGANAVSFIDLGADMVPNDDSPFTIELWTTLRSHGDEQRIFSFGESGDSQGAGLDNGIFLNYEGSSGGGNPHLVLKNSSDDWAHQGDVGSTALELGVEYHVVVAVTPGEETTDVAAYIYNASTGTKVGEWITTQAWKPSSCNFEHCYLGRSPWYNPDPPASFNEVRIWGKALTEAEVVANNKLGPDKVVAGCQGIAVAVESGATLDLQGTDATLATVSGSGTIVGGTVSLTGGTLTLAAGQCLNVTGNLDLNGATLNLVGSWSRAPFATATGTITGIPTISGDNAGNFKIRMIGNSLYVTPVGLMILFY